MGVDELEFGDEVCGQQSPQIRHAYLRQLMRNVSDKFVNEPILILEIGSWVGASAITWGNEIRNYRNSNGRLHCVDPWTPYFDENLDQDEHYKKMNELAGKGKAFEVFQRNIQKSKLADLISIHKGTSQEILSIFREQSFHIVYVDGAHEYKYVDFDLKEAKRLVKRGGVIAGDDFELAYKDLDEEKHGNYIQTGKDFALDPKTESYYHPGVTEAVYRNFNDVFSSKGFWAVSNEGGIFSPCPVQENVELIPTHLPTANAAPPQLLKEHKGFNLILNRNKYYGLRQSAGAINLNLTDSDLVLRYGAKNVLVEKDLITLEKKIKAM